MAIFTGETVEDAIERGLNRLNVKRENVHIHIEQKEKKGFLGFGKKRARVNIEPIHEENEKTQELKNTTKLPTNDVKEKVIETLINIIKNYLY